MKDVLVSLLKENAKVLAKLYKQIKAMHNSGERSELYFSTIQEYNTLKNNTKEVYAIYKATK